MIKKESSYIQYWDGDSSYHWAMSQNFERTKDTSQFNEDFIKIIKKKVKKRYFLQVDVQYLQKLYELHNDLPFLPETMKNEKVKKLVANYMIKLNMLYIQEI